MQASLYLTIHGLHVSVIQRILMMMMMAGDVHAECDRGLVMQDQDYRSFPRALADMLSARKVMPLVTEVIRSQLI